MPRPSRHTAAETALLQKYRVLRELRSQLKPDGPNQPSPEEPGSSWASESTSASAHPPRPAAGAHARKRERKVAKDADKGANVAETALERAARVLAERGVSEALAWRLAWVLVCGCWCGVDICRDSFLLPSPEPRYRSSYNATSDVCSPLAGSSKI